MNTTLTEAMAVNPVEDETETQMSTEILIMLALLMLSITCGHYLKKSGHKYLQEAGLTTIVGVFSGLILRWLQIG